MNNYVPGVCIYYTILFIVTLACTLSTYYKFAVKQYVVTPTAASYILSLLHLLIASFSLVLNLILCCFVQYHAVQACSLGGIGSTIQPRCVVGSSIEACVSVL